jgi:elongation factor Ts
MEIKSYDVKALRDETGAGMMDCKSALVESGGDIEIAKKILREKGITVAQKKSSRAANEGIIDVYVHPGNRVGVMVEVNCETDFVARNQEFRDFVHDLTLQVAAANPLYISRDDVPQSLVDSKTDIYIRQALAEGKSEAVVEKIIKDRLDKFYTEVCLLEQPFIRDQERTVGSLLIDLIAKVGENIEIRRFCRYQLGER